MLAMALTKPTQYCYYSGTKNTNSVWFICVLGEGGHSTVWKSIDPLLSSCRRFVCQADLISLYNKIQTDLESSIKTDVPALRTDPYEYSLQYIGKYNFET